MARRLILILRNSGRDCFNILVSNTDDHLRNHGYILIPGKGWRLSEAYDLNPVAVSDGLKLNITENDNALDLELAREVAEYFRLGLTEADDIIANFRGIVSQWRIIAERLRLPGREQELMAEAFRGQFRIVILIYSLNHKFAKQCQ